jgi:tRNA pseudouridine55 synthase
MDGILVIDKPAGPTSHDVVQMVKRAIGAAKVGHLGTLDPPATGVLPLCINGATKAAAQLMGGEKIYSFDLVLGSTTDTDDDTGKVLATHPVEQSHRARLADVAQQFVGETDQIPPQYSARKVNGRRMYKSARKGVIVTPKPRRVRIHEIVIDKMHEQGAAMRMRCDGGTYVRAVCRDIGAALGCGAHAANIRRLQSGQFTIAQALQLNDVPTQWKEKMICLPLEGGG